jgi:crossover junction endodeoxyribonuclease RuvC
MFYLWQQLEQLRSAYEFQEISMEKVFHGVNFKSALMLGQVRGVIFAFAGKFQLSVHEYNPTEVKKAITGYGRAEKHQMQHMVQLLLGLHQPPKPHDAADALGLAICHAHSAIPGQKS